MILGVDPGLGGALAFYDGNELLIYDMPTFNIERNGKKKRQIDILRLQGIFKLYKVDHAYLENVNAMPGQGVSSMFQMGRGFGQIEASIMACEFPLTYITPQKWKKDMAVPKDKDGARQRASQLLPQFAHNWDRKKDDGRAEASIIALYGYRINPNYILNC